MRYLVRAPVKPGCERALLEAIEDGTLGQGSVAEGEYLRNMKDARLCSDQSARWVEICYCPTPLQEERPYWEQYFELAKIQDAHDRRKCRMKTGPRPGPATAVIAQKSWNEDFRPGASLFSKRFAARSPP